MALQFQETHDLLRLPFRQNTRWSFRWLFHDITKVVCSVQLSRSGEGEVAQLCPTLCDPMDCNLLGFSIHRILQARILEWIAISLSRGSSRPRDRTRVSHIGGRRFNLWATREAKVVCSVQFSRSVNTKIRLIIFFAAKDGEALYSQQKQDQELTVAQIMNSLLQNSDWNWKTENH